jgi:hypothetical protein
MFHPDLRSNVILQSYFGLVSLDDVAGKPLDDLNQDTGIEAKA